MRPEHSLTKLTDFGMLADVLLFLIWIRLFLRRRPLLLLGVESRDFFSTGAHNTHGKPV